MPHVDDWKSLVGSQGPKTIWMRRSNRVGWPFDDYVNVDFQIDLKFEFGATYHGGGAFIPNIYGNGNWERNERFTSKGVCTHTPGGQQRLRWAANTRDINR